ncbi:ABC transporter G family member 20 isoform X6 [Ostrinia furnacalis]|uniref:ABC transporter G family member 20 isoform X1 n=1 Tax=Ostrinia furnacalis TaxID=93504 RepID=UPI00103CE8B8|nr:ABC transporter G family member 20 isoform X1 [Ostrinia furnacalis]XP_028158027.1 ABC transporter G family member 20 isoform X1 [Ostrinia furnacalis]XP_028158037.1 ABC transporter G family member 20 isoform X2 [Ostrinia furnacalis]XP_028158043.1 ABC transporter G family member 20 isoform X3 [Ostrinia furnacalis]XP_028158060.1 ABC transporter G family member 20 isoform X5 [Ostrinia furnacalis]XP_028158070.1 ABC transporter G family member 20 isoform X6 [Ostrinia furnacalis]
MPAYDNEGATISLEDVRADPPTSIQELRERRKEFKTQRSTVASRREQAVCVRGAFKKYGSSKNPNVILDGLNMTVPKGAIYGLLGASGCGKTTLLSCIVGRRRLNAGDIWVLGGRPGSPGSGVPGPRIGYMPQEIALFGEFTIRETMIYFGWIAGMDSEEIKVRSDFMVSLLQLPDPERFVKNLSGGQQRRVSFAAALLHDPELLILDEPTVGVDPVLRQSIWDHLVNISNGGRTTVIITTHYIDETKQANVIGLMRGGRFLAEESPTELIRRYQADSLEDVFLKLSVLQNRGKRRRSSILADVVDKVELPAMANPAATDAEEPEIGEISGEFGDNVSIHSKGVAVAPEFVPPVDMPANAVPSQTIFDKIKPVKAHHMKALVWKNAMSLLRNFGLLCFIILLPVSQMFFFCIAIGHYPEELPIAVVNYEINSTKVLCDYNKEMCPQNKETYEWEITNFSCRYLDFFHRRQSNLVYYPTTEEAIAAARKGKARVVMTFAANYSQSLQDRMLDNRHVDDYTVNASGIQINMDNADKQIEWMLARDISESFMEATEHMAEQCDLPKRLLSIPVHFNKPVFGLRVPNLTDFAGPGVILTIIYFLAVALTSGALLAERNEGILERSLVCGITGTEILFSQLVVQIVVMLIQTVIVLLMGFVGFQLSQNGPIGWVGILTMLTGFCGMTFGFVVATLCDTDRAATYLALGSFLPMVMLSGCIWPIEGMHKILRFVSYILPLTTSTESFRSMVQRGWGIETPQVYLGFIVTIIWILLHLTTSILLLKFKKG